MPDTPGVPGEAASPAEVIAGLRAANARLRELLAERDARIADLEAGTAELRGMVTGLQAQVADLAARVKQNSGNSSRPPSSDGLGKSAPKSLRTKTGRRPGRPGGPPSSSASASTAATARLVPVPSYPQPKRPDTGSGNSAQRRRAPAR